MTDYNQLYDSVPVPEASGDYPDKISFDNHEVGKIVEGTLIDVRTHTHEQYGPAIIHDIQLDDGTRGSVFCTTTSQRRLVNAKRPVPGQRVRWHFTGFAGQAKVFELLVADGGGAPAAAPAAPPVTQAPAPAPMPQPAAGQPAPQAPPAWGAAPAQPAPAPQPPAGPPAWA